MGSRGELATIPGCRRELDLAGASRPMTVRCASFRYFLTAGYRLCFFFQAEDGIRDIGVTGVQTCALPISALTAGTVLVMWLGELITQRGIGNGISLMIFASIVAGLPNGIQAWWTNPDQVFKVMMPFIALAVISSIVFVQEGQRRIPVQYAKRVIGRRMTQGGQTYLPLRVNMAGVIPVIFAASIMAFPPTVGQLIQQPWAQDLSNFFNPQDAPYIVGETIFIVLFTYFYTAVTFNPVDQADNLKKYGGVTPRGGTSPPNARGLHRLPLPPPLSPPRPLGAGAAVPAHPISQPRARLFLVGTHRPYPH